MSNEIPDETGPGRPGIFVTFDVHGQWLECDHGDGNGTVITELKPGKPWGDIVAAVNEHQTRHGCRLEPRPSPSAAADPEESCGANCGYHGSGQDLFDHQRYEHADCPRCGAKAPTESYDGQLLSVTHRPDCPRLKPGHRYADEATAPAEVES